MFTWIAAGAVIVMLLFGPALVAHDQAKGPYGGAGNGLSSADGKQVFITNCGSCHTLGAAGTAGQVGPDLDQTSLTTAQVASQVRQGGGSMPAFAGRLSNAAINAVAAFVATSSH